MTAIPRHIDIGLVAEVGSRNPLPEVQADAVALALAAATLLRRRFADHPKQERFWRSIARRLWALCTRRAGKSDGGVREWMAKAITIPGWRGVYVNENLKECRRIVWKNDLRQGWIDLLNEHGQRFKDHWILGGVRITANETLLEINFSNGSQIALFGADDENAINNLRGQAKDEIWVDEAQKFKYLKPFVEDVASACLKDKRGRLRLTGTPSEDCAGYFYECSCEPEDDVPLPGWDGHRWSVTDNPGFGRKEKRADGWYVVALGDVLDEQGVPTGASIDIDIAGPLESEDEAQELAIKTRWDRTAGDELALNGWTGEEAKFKREWLGKWVKGDARYVYPVHAVPKHVLVYAPQRLRPNPFRSQDPDWLDLDVAILDLPINKRLGRHYQWLFGMGADFGFWPDPFALVVTAFTQELPDVYEIFSWKQTKVDTDAQGVYMDALFKALPNLVSFVGDTVGKEKTERWADRLSLQIDPAEKRDKNALEEFLASDIRQGRYHFREGSPLLTEMRHLVYLPTKPGKTREVDKYRAVGGVVHGEHCCDAARYLHKDMTHYLYKPKEQSPATDLERLRREGERLERQVDDSEARRRRAQEQEETDLEARWGPGNGEGQGYYE